MAKASSFLDFGLVLSLLLIITTHAECRSIFGTEVVKSTPAVFCDSVVGVASGDTCFAIAQSHNLTTTGFDAINPNLNCTALFVGQWLCVDGFTN